jgi:hypothetical protein
MQDTFLSVYAYDPTLAQRQKTRGTRHKAVAQGKKAPLRNLPPSYRPSNQTKLSKVVKKWAVVYSLGPRGVAKFTFR